jgi:hypothetical protein
MGWKADTLWVADAELHRISLFDRTGEYLSTRRLGGAAFRNRYPLEPVALLSDGSILTSPHVTSPEVVSGELLDKPLLRITSDGASPDTVVWLSLRNSVLGIQNTEAPWRGLYSSQPFPDNPLWQLAPDGSSIIVVDRTAPATIEEATIGVSRIGLAGDTIWSRRYAFAPAILRDELRDSVVTQWVDLVLEARGPGITSQRVAERRVREAVHLPPFYPGVEGSYFATGRDGSVWLPVRQAVEPQKAYWLVNSDGRLVAQIPRTFDILYGTDQTLWGRESDELDVPYVVRYAVRDD